MSYTLQGIIDDAKESLDECGLEEGDEPHDAIAEVADGAGPVYTGDLMQLAADNIDLATATPELGPAFDGEPTPVNIVAANIYEAITQALHDYWNDKEWDDEDDD